MGGPSVFSRCHNDSKHHFPLGGVRMSYSDYMDDYISVQQFDEAYEKIKSDLVQGKSANSDKCTIILGGQPGAGKSSFYEIRDDLLDYIPINGDEYRRFHPNYQQILKSDPEHYAERTQTFSNKIVETLISDLGAEGYNLIIEGTLRNPEVPIRTCQFLKDKGYEPELIVVACDAETAWKSTIKRANALKNLGLAPRLVPIDIYNNTVNQIPRSLDRIEAENCFKDITIINRDGDILYKTGQNEKASDILTKELNLDNWRQKLHQYEEFFIKEKIAILQLSLEHSKGLDFDEH